MDNLSFIKGLVASGELKWCQYPWHEHAEIVGKGLTICDYKGNDEWSVWTKRFTIHVHTVGEDLAAAWPSLDWNALVALAQRLDHEFSLTPDF